MQSKCAHCGIKKSRFVKKQQAKGLLSNLEIKITLNSIVKCFVLRCIKMNEIVNKCLLVGDRACGPFTKNKERMEKLKQTGNRDFIYRNELDKACFQHDMAYRKSNGLEK